MPPTQKAPEQADIDQVKPEAQPLESSGKYGPDAESIKLFYPYSIKLDAFSRREEAEKSFEVYRQKGLSPFWVKVSLGDQGVWYRVFAGYFENQTQAVEVIKAHNLKGAEVKNTKFAALIGTYRSEAEVNIHIRHLSEQGFSPYVVKGPSGELYLYVGAFYTQKGAQDQVAELLAGGIQSKIVER